MEPVFVYFALAFCVALLSLLTIIIPVILDSQALGSTISNQHPIILGTVMFIMAFIAAPFTAYVMLDRNLLKQVHVGLASGLSD
jgi:hypothetical protein